MQLPGLRDVQGSRSMTGQEGSNMLIADQFAKVEIKAEDLKRDEKSRVLIELKTLVRVIAAQSYSDSTGSNTVEANPHDGLPYDHDRVPQQSSPECQRGRRVIR
ncbi:hypothetical protein NL676_030723 [Syzygium grande]|nr:hypothetical protein NL676_030723 [Syzygium grande]